GDVVVAAPVGGALGVGELVHEVAAELGGQPAGLAVDGPRVFDEVALPAVPFDQFDLLAAGGLRDDGDERQPQHAGEVRLGNRGGTGGGLDDRRVLGHPAVADRVQEQGSGQPVLQGTRRVR